MLDEHEIKAAIAELEYKESSYSNYQKLASLYTIINQMHKVDAQPNPASMPMMYSAAAAPENRTEVYGDSDFLQAVAGKDLAGAWAVMDELMDTLHTVNPRVYDGVMRKISTLD